MGCGSTMNRKDVQRTKEYPFQETENIREETSTPKNDIFTLNLTENLLRLLEEHSNKQKFPVFKEMILSNHARSELRLDEITYVMNIAKQ